LSNLNGVASLHDSDGSGTSVSDQLTGWTHQIVDALRDRTIKPLMIAVRGLIVGMFAIIIAIVVSVAGLIALTRIFDTSVFHGRVWATDLLFGVILMAFGLMLLRQTKQKEISSGGR